MAGTKLEGLRRCRRQPGCEPAGSDIAALAAALNKLDLETDAFIDGSSALFLERASELEHARLEP